MLSDTSLRTVMECQSLSYARLSAGLHTVVLSCLRDLAHLPEVPDDIELFGEVLGFGIGTA